MTIRKKHTLTLIKGKYNPNETENNYDIIILPETIYSRINVNQDSKYVPYKALSITMLLQRLDTLNPNGKKIAIIPLFFEDEGQAFITWLKDNEDGTEISVYIKYPPTRLYIRYLFLAEASIQFGTTVIRPEKS